MTVISVDTDNDTLTVTVVSDFDASVARVWELWTDPRRIERWWGPPAYPATFRLTTWFQAPKSGIAS